MLACLVALVDTISLEELEGAVFQPEVVVAATLVAVEVVVIMMVPEAAADLQVHQEAMDYQVHQEAVGSQVDLEGVLAVVTQGSLVDTDPVADIMMEVVSIPMAGVLELQVGISWLHGGIHTGKQGPNSHLSTQNRCSGRAREPY